jgi:CRISPR-associated protein Cmr3
MSLMTWRFTAFDSLFFRESRPFDSIGSSELGSVFPPSPTTMAGAIRSVIGEHKKVVWQNFPQDYLELQAQIGDSGSLGAMRLKGIFLSRKNSENDAWERLYPVPAYLVATKEKAEIKALHFLQVGEPVKCDLGEQVCFPVAPRYKQGKNIEGIKPQEGYWLTQTGLTQVLNGQLPSIHELIPASTLFTREARLGIARNNPTRTVETGLLYQTQHVRPKPSLCIEVDVEGLEASLYPQKGIVRLGGEGRGAAFEVIPFEAGNNLPKSKLPEAGAIGIKLLLLSAVHVPQSGGYSPLPGFKKAE